MKDFVLPVLITGASGGLGLAVTEGLLRRGYRNIIGHYRSDGTALSNVLCDYGLTVERNTVRADLVSESQVEDMYRHVEERFGGVWGLVNMAGASTNGMSWRLALDDFESVLAANLKASFLTTRAVLNGMRSRRGGRIVNISSVVAHVGGPGASHYAAAKAAVEGFTRSVALEVASRGVTVNCLALGYFDKGLISHLSKEILESIVGRIPIGRLGIADEVTPLVNYLLSDESAFMTGQVLHLDGGLRL
jgi:3-oxoacyl-[acyl-carrier protein] reductase